MSTRDDLVKSDLWGCVRVSGVIQTQASSLLVRARFLQGELPELAKGHSPRIDSLGNVDGFEFDPIGIFKVKCIVSLRILRVFPRSAVEDSLPPTIRRTRFQSCRWTDMGLARDNPRPVLGCAILHRGGTAFIARGERLSSRAYSSRCSLSG